MDVIDERRAVNSWSLLALALAGSAACSSSATGEGARDVSRIYRETTIVHEACPVELAETQDLNQDGRPDRMTVTTNGKPVCWGLDLNFDGSMDDWAYADAEGRVRRRESDFDRDGRIDEVALYRSGVLVEKRRATTLHGTWDTWHYYVQGLVDHTERDANGDGAIDQWWEYKSGRTASCPLIHSDVDGDGRPDPGATVDLCEGEDLMAGEPEQAEPKPTKAPLQSVPTEVSTNASSNEEQGGGIR